jgi:hypothetical protein
MAIAMSCAIADDQGRRLLRVRMSKSARSFDGGAAPSHVGGHHEAAR